MKKLQFVFESDETGKPVPTPSCPTCRSGIDPTISGIEFAAALKD